MQVDRSAVRAAMTFALDNAEAAAEIADTLGEALGLTETPVPTKVLRTVGRSFLEVGWPESAASLRSPSTFGAEAGVMAS